MSYKCCQHVKENGTQCRSAAMRGRNYCYFHARLRARRLGMAKIQAQGEVYRLSLPPLEDMFSVQTALLQVLDAIAAGAVDTKRGGLLLYGLQQAARNMKTMSAWLGPSRFEVDAEDEDRVESAPALEHEFGLPKKCSLDTIPEVAFPLPQKAPLMMEAEHAFVDAFWKREKESPGLNLALAAKAAKRPPANAPDVDVGSQFA